MKYKFENSVSLLLFFMFTLVLAQIVFSNCIGCVQSKENAHQAESGGNQEMVDSIK